MAEAKVREYRLTDFEKVKKLHEQVWPGCSMPAIDSPYACPINRVLEIDGEIRAVGLGTMEIEAHLMLDKGNWGGPIEKFLAIKATQESFMQKARELRICSVFSTVHEDVEKTFWKRMVQLGWTKSNPGWNMWFHDTTE